LQAEDLPAQRYVQNGDAKLFCRSLGKGSPVIVIHGGPGLTQDYLLPQMYQLAEDHFVIFYDQRGCGESTAPIDEQSINVATFISDLEAIRKAYNVGRIAVIGHSWGGFLAIQYAIKHPEAISKLILSNSMSATSEDLALFLKEWIKRMGPFKKEIDDIKASPEFKEGNSDTVEKYYRIMYRTYCFNPEDADLLNLRMSPKAFINGQKVYGFFREQIFTKEFNFIDSLKKLSMPVLIIHGDFDPIPVSSTERVHHAIEGSKLVLMKDCGHFPYVENPKLYFKEIDAFLK